MSLGGYTGGAVGERRGRRARHGAGTGDGDGAMRSTSRSR